MFQKALSILLALCFIALTASACGQPGDNASVETTAVVTNLSKPDMTKWQYNEDFNIYYQVGIDYCETPADKSLEQLAIFVPGAYMNATDNGDGTYTCELNEKAEVNGYTAQKAPIAMHVATEGYRAAEPITDELLEQYKAFFELVDLYASQGIVYVHPACRGINEGAPSGVTDLKAAIRYLRYSDDMIAGDAESIFVFGMSGGGAQSAILGASGDSALYDPYLEAIGAVQGVSDAVCGSMDWCPVTSLDTADAEYEWMMGCTHRECDKEEQEVSDRLAAAYAKYINSAGFTDENGTKLTLEESDEGIYQAGSYYEYIKSEIERSLNNYISDSGFSDEKAREYIDTLNKDKQWVSYEKSTHKASITSVADFVKACKNAFPYYVGFDNPPGNNTLFGYGDGEGSHFDRILADILTELNSEYAADYNADLEKTDFVGNSVERRVEMYAPLYYLMESREGFGTSTVAPYWRIRTGIKQPTNSVTTEVNLALALKRCEDVKDVDFETVWERGHEEAERSGNSTENFIAWVNACMKKQA